MGLRIQRTDPVLFRTHEIWRGMIKRCRDPRNAYYGAKGVSVCAKWVGSFDAFLADVGRIPAPYSIDRIDNARGYEPGNVRLATIVEQNRNRSVVKSLTFGGVTRPRAEWATILGITRQALNYRIRRGIPLDQALTRQAMPRGQRSRGWRGDRK